MRTLMALAFVAFAAPAFAQEVERPGFRPHRFDEDWRALCNDARQIRHLDPLKCVRLGPETTLTLGGELRERVEAVRNPGFGINQESDHVFLHRATLHGDLRVGDTFRGFVQLGAFGADGREGASAPTDENRFDLVQGFVDLSAPAGDGRAILRGGRQEMSFGSSRLVSVREGPNVRRAFDGARAFYLDEEFRIDAFVVRPVEIRPGSFDDRTLSSETFWGVYGAGRLAGRMNLDMYYLGLDRDRARFAAGVGREERRTVGARLSGADRGWDWDWEAAYQFGRFNGGDIRAWTLATDTGFTFETAPLSPRLGLKADIASGDRDLGDDTLGTFNALYPKFPYFSEASLIAPANFIDLHPSLEVQLNSTLSADVGVNWLWRETVRDAIYQPPLGAVAQTAGGGERYIGAQFILGFHWQATPNIAVSGQYVHFQSGDTLRSVGGGDVDFATLSAAFKF